MNDLSNQLEEVQTVHSINAMMLNISQCFDLFRFLVGEKAQYCTFEKFLYFYHKADGDLVTVLEDFLGQNNKTNINFAIEAAKSLLSVQQMIEKSDYSDYDVEFVEGDKDIFDILKKNFHHAKKMKLTHPGEHSKQAFFIAIPKHRLFIKPSKTEKRSDAEDKSYEVAKQMGLEEHFLPNCVIKFNKSFFGNSYAVVTRILPHHSVTLEKLEKTRSGAGDGLVKKWADEGISHKLALFDYLIDNSDRHRNNIFVDGDKILLIDHGEAFKKKDKGFIPGYLRKKDYKQTKQLPKSSSDNEIKEWINKLHLKDSALQKKLDSVKEKLKSPSSSASKVINELWESYYKD